MNTLRCLLGMALLLWGSLLGATQAAWAVDKSSGKADKKSGDAPANKKILLITESRGYRHSCVTRNTELLVSIDPQNPPKVKDVEIQVSKGKDGKVSVQAVYIGRVSGTKPFEIKHEGKPFARVQPCVVEVTFLELGKKHGFEATCTQNSREEINVDNLKNYDAVFFYTTGELPLSEVQKSDLLAFVRSGKGFGGSHCATDTFYKWKEYGELIGAYFDGHPWHQKIKVLVEDPANPATKHLGKSFEITDEIYQFKGPYSREKLRVLMRLDMDSVKDPAKRQDRDNALAWVHEFGKGRVFYTALGHRDEVWRDERFQQHILGGLRFLFGQEKADTAPRAASK
ncbi:MAG: ThuA domain-containing protein [Planctomycetes bacterium]|nr:ThuA domain-containing protein [Planctomycetota bacterium]